MEKANKILVEEHVNILRIADAIEKECAILDRGKKINDNFFIAVVNFIKNYADKFHHAKEEDILFKEFNKKAEEGGAHCNPVGQMLAEHDEGRGFVKGIGEGMAEKNREKVIGNAKAYVMLIREHISKEDDILYPMAEGVIGEKEYSKMLKKFEDIGEGKKMECERYVNLSNELEGGKNE